MPLVSQMSYFFQIFVINYILNFIKLLIYLNKNTIQSKLKIFFDIIRLIKLNVLQFECKFLYPKIKTPKIAF